MKMTMLAKQHRRQGGKRDTQSLQSWWGNGCATCLGTSINVEQACGMQLYTGEVTAL